MSPTNDRPIDDVSGVEERPQNRREWSGVLRSLLLPVIIVATIVGGLVYVERARSGGGAVVQGSGIVALPAEKNITGQSPSSDVGRAAPDFMLKTPDGGELRLSDLQGHPVLVNFWASWCTPCREEMPRLVKMYDAQQSSGLVVVAVDLQENTDMVRSFADEFGMKFPIVIDPNGGVAAAWRIGGPIKGIPSSYFVDAHGVVQARVYGPMTDDTFASNLKAIGVGG